MKINYCLPIIKNKKEEVLKMINDNLKSYDYFEVWLDYIEDLDENFVKSLIGQFEDKIIFLFRRKNLEEIKMSLQQRKEIISFLSGKNSYLDLDVIQQKDELEYIKINNLKLQTIISYHNYKETPSIKKLSEITEKIVSHKPVILKISCFCNTKEDSEILITALAELKDRKAKFIVSGMGEFGTMVKVQGAILGNEMTFAPITDKEQSAPGQLTKNQFEEIFCNLNK